MKQRVMFQEGHSFLHRLHPVVKLGWLLFCTVFVFVAPHLWMVLVLLLLIILAIPFSNLKLGGVRGVRLLLVTACLLAILQIIFNDQGRTLWMVGPVKITTDGLETGLFVAARFISVVLISYIFVLTTSPNDLAYALIQAGVPYRYGFAFVTAIRLVPVFEEEASIVYQAQLARGIQYDSRNLKRFLILARQFLLPMLVSALSKVDALAVSMEGRCFGKYKDRTFLREVHYAWYDYLGLALLLIATVSTIGVAWTANQ
jgi:energy-coupling factor transport system permease protein